MSSDGNARRIELVEECFGSSGQPLAAPGRVLVAEGVLTKACRKKTKHRMFFLFNDLLVYGNIIISNMKYNLQHIIPLEDVKLESLEDDGLLKHGWLICTRGKSFAVYADTANEKQEWMENISKCIENLLKKSGKKAAESHAAVLVPLSVANTCMICKKVQFTLVNRPYHCRKCGKICCHPCSSKRFLMPAHPDKPMRVCISCYDVLTKRPPKGQTSADGVPLVSKTKEISTLKPPPPSPASNPSSFDPEHEQDIHENDEEAYQPIPASKTAPHPNLYKIATLSPEFGASTGLWWDSFEEEPDFDWSQCFEDGLTLNEEALDTDTSDDDLREEAAQNSQVEKSKTLDGQVGSS